MKRFTVVTVSVIALLGAVALFATAETQKRTVYFSAVDKKGAPVADLTAADVVVKEAGRTQTPLTLARATTPMRIAIVVDDHGQGVPEVREGLTKFVDALHGQAEVGVFSTMRPEVTVVDFTRDDQALDAGIQTLVRLAPHMGGPSTSLDRLTFDLSRQFEKQSAARPVIVVVAVDETCTTPRPGDLVGGGDVKPFGALGDTPPFCENSFVSPAAAIPQQVVEQLQRSSTTFFGIAARHLRPADRDPVIAASAEVTGGRVEDVMTDSDIPVALTHVTDDLLNQYVVTYDSSPTPNDGARLRVEVNRPGVIVHAPERVGVR